MSFSGKAPTIARKESLRSYPASQSNSSKSSNASSRATTPTAASASRSIVAPKMAAPSSGSGAPRLPSHMKDSGRRAPSRAATVVEMADEGDLRPQSSATYVSSRPSPPSSPSAAPVAATVGGVSSSGDSSFVSSYSDLTPGSSAASQHSSPSPLALDNESVTAALQQRAVVSPEGERFFQGAGRSLPLYKETLSESVERYHNVYDSKSKTDEDPLLYYGAVGGELPGYDSAASLLLREVVMRYQYPHKSFDWERLSDLIAHVAAQDASTSVIMPTVSIHADTNPETVARGFALNLAELSQVAQAVVGVQQTLSALNAFLLKNPNRSFDVDPGYGFLYLLEFSENPSELRFAYTSLQLRLQRADVHIRSYLSSIRRTTLGDDFSSRVSSTESTLSEVRPVSSDRGPDYGRRAAIISSYAREQMVDALDEPPREYYRKRDRGAIPTLKEKGKESATPIAAPSSLRDSAAPAAASAAANLGVRFTTPSSPPSVTRISAVGSLPGAGVIRDTLSVSTAGGPSVTRPISTKGILPAARTEKASSLPPPGQSWTTYAYKTSEAGAASASSLEGTAGGGPRPTNR
ncbi:hypothetical protein C8R46DRAFT_1038102 [Mycena filopes]|nr:hypothetical protein C8R46DRAFT_1038102 [Mycena filopes]